MYTGKLESKRCWNWQVFFVLSVLILAANFAILPFIFHQQNTYSDTTVETPGWGIAIFSTLVNSLLIIILSVCGLLLTNRIGLGLPIIEGWHKRESVSRRVRVGVAISWIAAVVNAFMVLFLQKAVFDPPMMVLFEEIGYTTPQGAITPPLYGFMAAFSAGVAEEVLMRLFSLSLLAWLGGLFLHDSKGRPTITVLWIANFVSALGFGASHLSAAASLGWPLNSLIIIRTLVLNGIGGLVLGWLFWSFGLEVSMLSHFFTDVILYTFLPIIALQEGEPTRLLVLAGEGIVILLAVGWACRTLYEEHRQYKMQNNNKAMSKAIVPVFAKEKSNGNLAICTQDLSKEFNGVEVLKNLSLEVPAGSIFGFLGPNGAGKTTTIRLLLGLLEPTSGNAQVSGFDSHTQADQIRTHTGALLEHNGIYEQMSAENNLEFYGRAFLMSETERNERIEELLTRLGLWERRKDRAGTWSRGMKQKLALARTLLHQPSLILLDEPTAGLDVQAAVAIREDLQILASQENVTIFLTTHNLTEAEKLCHQVAVIRQGSLVALGRPQDLRARSSIPRIEIKGRGFNEMAMKLLHSHPYVRSVIAQNSHLLIDLKTETDVSALVSSLVGVGVQIEEVRRNQVSLEQVVLTLTGEKNV